MVFPERLRAGDAVKSWPAGLLPDPRERPGPPAHGRRRAGAARRRGAWSLGASGTPAIGCPHATARPARLWPSRQTPSNSVTRSRPGPPLFFDPAKPIVHRLAGRRWVEVLGYLAGDHLLSVRRVIPSGVLDDLPDFGPLPTVAEVARG